MEDVKDMGKGSPSDDKPLTPEELEEAIARENKHE